jgi:hypothetical protein
MIEGEALRPDLRQTIADSIGGEAVIAAIERRVRIDDGGRCSAD